MMQSSAVSRQYSKEHVFNEKEANIISHCSKSTARGWRFLDIGLASLALLLGLPFLLLIALIIKIDSPGPVVFIQRRLGLNGREFACYKLRTMYREPASLLEEHLQDHPDRFQEWYNYAKLRDDPRVTRIGRFLRRFSLDELPQLINVIKGDMSLVGPRPYLMEERLRLGEYAEIILSVPPGLTGLWQVSGRNELDFASRLRLEAWYAVNRSWRLDLLILLKTLPAVLLGWGAY